MNDDATGGASACFPAFKAVLQRRFGDAVYDSWMAELEFAGERDGAVILSSPSELKTNRLNQQYRPGMEAAWCDEVSPIKRLIIETNRRRLSDNAARSAAKTANGVASHELKNGALSRATRNSVDSLRVATLGSAIDARHTFDAFAVDATNEVAYAAAKRIFLDTVSREVVYIYGQSGVGKTHLLQAIAHEWAQRNPGDRFTYFTHANMRDCVAPAAMSNSLPNLHNELLARRLIIIDDLHFLISSKRTVEEILNLVNAFTASGHQIVIAGEHSPVKLAQEGPNQRLADRLAGGLSAPIELGGEALRAEVLRKRRDQEVSKCKITDEAIGFIAKHFPQSMREAIGAYKQLALVYSAKEMTIGAEEARIALKSRLGDQRPRATLNDLLEAAARAFGVSVGELTGRGQPQRIVRGRHGFTLVGREVLGESFPSLGKALGRDHTTVMSSYDRAQALHDRDARFRAAVAAIKADIGA